MSTVNTALNKEFRAEGLEELYMLAPPAKRDCALTLVADWYEQIRFLEGSAHNTCKNYFKNVERLLIDSGCFPWELRKQSVTKYLSTRRNPQTGEPLSPATVSSYCSAWRSFQSFLLDDDTVNIIETQVGARPRTFLNEENAIALKRAKSNWRPSGWALSEVQIEAIEAWFVAKIANARKKNKKSYLPLLRDRIMFHMAIHYALRVSELTTITLEQFSEHHNPALAKKYGKYGQLTVTGKGGVTGTIPTREEEFHEELVMYIEHIRPLILARRKSKPGMPTSVHVNGVDIPVRHLLFITERGGRVSPSTVRARLKELSMELCLPQRVHPHVLRHTGCTLMVPIYSPEKAKVYMRHRDLRTTLYYYHEDPLNAGAHMNPEYAMSLKYEEEDDVYPEDKA